MHRSDSAVLSHLSEAIAAVDGSVRLGLEGNLRLAAAVGADSGEVLSGASGSVLSGVAAGLAALGLILEASLSVKLLLTGRENELISTLFANQCLVIVHCLSSLLTKIFSLAGNICDQLSDVARIKVGCKLAPYALDCVINGLFRRIEF